MRLGRQGNDESRDSFLARMPLMDSVSRERVQTERIVDLKRLRDGLVGNRRRKVEYAQSDGVRELVASTDSDAPTAELCIVLLGLLAVPHHATIDSLCAAGVLDRLWQLLQTLCEVEPSPELDVLQQRTVAALLALVTAGSTLQHAQVLSLDAANAESLVRTLSICAENETRRATEGLCRILALLAVRKSAREQLWTVAEPGDLLSILAHCTTLTTDSFDALRCLIDDEPLAVEALSALSDDPDVLFIVDTARSSLTAQDNLIRVQAAAFLVAASTAMDTQLAPDHLQMPALVGALVSDMPLSGALLAIEALTRVVAKHEELQRQAAAMETCQRLARLIKLHSVDSITVQPEPGSAQNEVIDLTQRALQLLAAIVDSQDLCRQRLVDAKLLSTIAQLLDHPLPLIRLNAFIVVRAMSRSPRYMRPALSQSGIGAILARRLQDEKSIEVLHVVLACVNNALIEGSPVKTILTDERSLARLGGFIRGDPGPLRTAAMAAMKNASYAASSDLKQRVISAIGWTLLVDSADTLDKIYQVEVLGLVRNLACSTEQDIALVISGFSETVLWQTLGGVLLGDRPAASVCSAMGIMINCAAARDSYRKNIVARGVITRSLLQQCSHESIDVRITTIQTIEALSRPNPRSQRRTNEPLTILRKAGFEARLQSCLETERNDGVRDRLTSALSMFTNAT